MLHIACGTSIMDGLFFYSWCKKKRLLKTGNSAGSAVLLTVWNEEWQMLMLFSLHTQHKLLSKLLLSVLPCPLPRCPLSAGMTNSHFTDLATLGICQSCTSILILTQYALNVSQPLVFSVTQRGNTRTQSVLIISSSLYRIFPYLVTSIQCSLLEWNLLSSAGPIGQSVYMNSSLSKALSGLKKLKFPMIPNIST